MPFDRNQDNGYAIELFTASAEVDPNLICGLCHRVAKTPVEGSGCGHVYCSKCIQRRYTQAVGSKNIVCPYPDCPGSLPKNTCLTFFVQRIIEALAVTCPNRCGAKNLVLGPNGETFARHLEDDCERELVTCPMCNDHTIYRCALSHHRAHTCPQRMISCRHDRCKREMTAQKLAEHQANEAECADYEYCPHSCHCVKYAEGNASIEYFDPSERPHDTNATRTVMSKTAMSSHLTNDCPIHEHPCRLGCGAMLRKSQVSTHEASDCLHRPVTCKVCRMEFKQSELSNHQKNDVGCVFCSKCSNGCQVIVQDYSNKGSAATSNSQFVTRQQALDQNLPVEDTIIVETQKHAHQTQHCPLHPIPCRVCSKMIQRHSMNEHLEHSAVDHVLAQSDHISALVDRVAVLESQLQLQLQPSP